MIIELIYAKTCPNIVAAREQLLCAFNAVGIAPIWTEWESSDPAMPGYAHGYGSPTILVNGKDVLGALPGTGASHCRVYASSQAQNQGVPPLEQITQALQRASQEGNLTLPGKDKTIFGLNLSILPAVGMALLPKIFCPACWPAYAGLLSSLGVGFFDYTPYLLPAMLLFIVVALVALVYRARARRGYQPFCLGLVASSVLLSSKFYWDSDPLMWLGLIMLIVASLWNSWPKKNAAGHCPACLPVS